MSEQSRIDAALLERRLSAYARALSEAQTMEERRQYWDLVQAAVRRRSAAINIEPQEY